MWQHPRDLYDVKILFDNEGITEEIRKGIVIYFASHDASISQLINPIRKDILEIYHTHFEGMTSEPVTLKQLLETRELLIKTVQSTLTREEREFLLTLKQGNPQWQLIGIPNVDKLPAIQWKLANIKKMNPSHHRDSVERLRSLLSL